MKKKYLIIGAVVLILLGLGVYYFVNRDKTPDYIYFSNGRLDMTLINAATLYGGRVTEILVSEGDEVVKDQPVVKMQNTETQSQINIVNAAKQRGIEAKERAKSEYSAYQQKMNVSKLDYNNALKLRKDNLISDSELQKRKALYLADKASLQAVSAATKEADAAIQEAQANIDRIESIEDDLTIKSPIDGRVEYKLVEIGSVIPQGGKVVSIVDYKDVYMNIYLTTASTANIRLGDEARIILDNMDAVFPATIKYVSGEAQFTPKYVETELEREKMMYRVKLQIPEDIAVKYNKLLKNGLTGNGYVKTDPEAKWPSNLEIKLPKD
ncbi:HlyD family efflux transporter periplasmic adaptor subunit [Neisseriaceae bacterium PsAf]|nr:HlyD family efflux transporter periplasmic adaptor subunit [Neisseriaceae bacterium PsAf]